MLTKYNISSAGLATFKWVANNVNISNIGTLSNIYGGTGIISVEVVGTVNNSVVYSESFEGADGAYRIGDDAANGIPLILTLNQTVDELTVEAKIHNPDSASSVYINSSNGLNLIDGSGISKMNNVTYFYGQSPMVIPEELFQAARLERINFLNVVNLTNLDNRFANLYNLNRLDIGLTTTESLNTSVLQSLPLLDTCTFWLIGNDLDDNFINFDSSWNTNTTLETLILGRSASFLNIPDSLKQLNLKSLTIEYFSLNTVTFTDIVIPKRGATNDTLEEFKLIGSSQTNAHVVHYLNLAECTALNKITHIVLFNDEQRNINQATYFYKVFYQEIFYKPGNPFSDASLISGYFSTIPAPSNNTFVHPSLRTLYCHDNGSKVIDPIYSDSLLEMRNDGLTLEGSFYTTIRRKGLEFVSSNNDYVELPSEISFPQTSDWYIEVEGTIERLLIGGNSIFTTLNIVNPFTEIGTLPLTIRATATYFSNGSGSTFQLGDIAQDPIKLNYKKLKIVFNGSTDKSLQIYYNTKLIYDQILTTYNNYAVRYIGIRSDYSNPTVGSTGSAAFCSDMFLSKLDLNGNVFDFNLSSGNTITSSLGTVATIHTANIDQNVYIDSMWKEKDITL